MTTYGFGSMEQDQLRRPPQYQPVQTAIAPAPVRPNPPDRQIQGPPNLASLINPHPPSGPQVTVGNQSPWNFASGRIPVYGPNGQPLQQNSGQQRLLDQAVSLIGTETGRAQELMGGRYSQGQNGNFERNQGIINQLGQLLGGAPGQVRQMLDAAGRPIDSLIGQMNGMMGQQQGAFDQYSKDFTGSLDRGMAGIDGLIQKGVGYADSVGGSVDQANNWAGQAVQNAIATRNQYGQQGLTDIAGKVAGFAQSAQTAIASANSRFRPDGTVKSADEMGQERAQIQGQIGVQTAQTVAGMQADIRNNMASLGMQVSGFMDKAADVALQGGAMKLQAGALLGDLARTKAGAEATDAQARLGLGGQQLQLQQGQREMLGMVSSLRQFWSQIQVGTQFNVLQLQAAGLQNQAQLQMQNPEGMASLFSGLATLFGMATAPGAGNISGVNFGNPSV